MKRKQVVSESALQLQQGDVFLEQVKSIPSDAQPIAGAVFAEGEGHHLHRAAVAENVKMYVLDGIRYARFARETIIEHVTVDGCKGEHNPIIVPPGDYQFGQVSEYDYLAELSRTVVD